MASYKTTASVDFRTLDLWSLNKTGGSFSGQAPQSYVLKFFDKTSIVVKGSGFSYDPKFGYPVSGTTTEIVYHGQAGSYATLSGIKVPLAQENDFFSKNNVQYVLTKIFAGNDTITGSRGNDYLNGFSGADHLQGGAGNDTYVVDNGGDRVFEAKGGGSDTVLTSVSYRLAAGQEIEALRALAPTSSAKLTLVGNEFGQTLVGTSGANTLDGGLGIDVLTGGKGGDTFVFSTALGAGNVDRITDFAVEDTIRLSKSIFTALAPGELAAGALKNISTGKLDADDRILYKQKTGELFYDADGSGKGLAVKFAVLDNKAAITAADFFVV